MHGEFMSIKKHKVACTLVAAVVVIGAAAGYYAWQPAIDPLAKAPVPETDQTLIKQGAIVAELGDCLQCDTAYSPLTRPRWHPA